MLQNILVKDRLDSFRGTVSQIYKSAISIVRAVILLSMRSSVGKLQVWGTGGCRYEKI